jgi:Septum formation
MAAPAELTGGSVPEPTEPEPPEPDPAQEAGEAADIEEAGEAADAEEAREAEDDDALAVADPELVPAQPASGTGRHRGTSWLAVAAVVFGLVALAGVAVGALAVATHGFRPKTVIQYHLAAVFSLRPGDCVNTAPNGLSVTVLSCATPHDGEVFATFPLTAPSWPGDAAVQTQASNGCLSRIAGYLNPQLANAGLAQEYFYPDEAAWQAGVRTVVCEIRAPTGQLTGSVRAPG